MFTFFVESFKSRQQACIVLTFEKCKLASEGNNKPYLDQLSFIQCLTAEEHIGGIRTTEKLHSRTQGELHGSQFPLGEHDLSCQAQDTSHNGSTAHSIGNADS